MAMKERTMAVRPVSEAELRAQCERLRNWGRFGADDEAGTLNHVRPEDIVRAAGLIRTGRVFSLAIPFDTNGPQTGRKGRYNPIHMMIQSGVDAHAGVQDQDGLRFADDAVMTPLQAGTHWDALSHVFYDDTTYNGHDVRLVDSTGAKRLDIAKVAGRMVGRGVLLDLARAEGLEWLEDGHEVGAEALEAAAASQGVTVGRGDFLLLRTGQMARCRAAGSWGHYAGGPAPGLGLDTADWLQAKEVAAIACDTYAVEVRPEATEHIRRPWHWVVIPNMGLTVGEIFFLDALAADCAADGVWDFFFSAAPLPITGAVGSPVNPIAIK
jgi:kynurenine formamidase